MTLTIKKEKTMPNYDKLRLGRTLSSRDGDNNNHGDCFNYGSVGGCDAHCPALLEGKCENIHITVVGLDIPDEDVSEILSVYNLPQHEVEVIFKERI